MRSFFPISSGDLSFIAALLAFAVVAFLPWTRNMQWAGMSMLGWMMALLMVLSPAIALVRVMTEDRMAASKDQEVDE